MQADKQMALYYGSRLSPKRPCPRRLAYVLGNYINTFMKTLKCQKDISDFFYCQIFWLKTSRVERMKHPIHYPYKI